MTINVREAQRDRAAARRAWDAMTHSQRWDIGDALVLGTFDWIDWFTHKPSKAFLVEIDNCCVLWEC